MSSEIKQKGDGHQDVDLSRSDKESSDDRSHFMRQIYKEVINGERRSIERHVSIVLGPIFSSGKQLNFQDPHTGEERTVERMITLGNAGDSHSVFHITNMVSPHQMLFFDGKGWRLTSVGRMVGTKTAEMVEMLLSDDVIVSDDEGVFINPKTKGVYIPKKLLS